MWYVQLRMSEMKTARPRIPSPLTAGIVIDHSVCNNKKQQIAKIRGIQWNTTTQMVISFIPTNKTMLMHCTKRQHAVLQSRSIHHCPTTSSTQLAEHTCAFSWHLLTEIPTFSHPLGITLAWNDGSKQTANCFHSKETAFWNIIRHHSSSSFQRIILSKCRIWIS